MNFVTHTFVITGRRIMRPWLVENIIAIAIMTALILLPILEIAFRPFSGRALVGSIDYVRHLTLWIGMIGGVLAIRGSRHLGIATSALMSGNIKTYAKLLSHTVACITCLVLGYASLEMVIAERESITMLGGLIPLWVAQSIMPLCFALMALRFIVCSSDDHRKLLLVTAMALLILLLFTLVPEAERGLLLWPSVGVIVLSAIAGAPIFVLLGSLAALLYFVDNTPLASISVEAYRIAANPILPTIPLFTLAGTILSAGNASQRMVRLFRALFDWLPGGTSIASICVCAFFTTFTGGSGVAILALGALLLPVLIRQRYSDRFATGLVTASGSLGILFPPSLVVILYGVTAHIAIDQLFIAGLIPGLLIVLLTCGYAIWKAPKRSESIRVARPHDFMSAETLAAIWESKWEIMLPVLVLLGIFSGVATMVEIAAAAALYAFIVEFLLHKDLTLHRDFPRIMRESLIMIGGIMIIISTAMGLTSYLVFADISTQAAEWVRSITTSPWVFLLVLNGFLLLAGCLLDIYSAIVVFVPLVMPIADSYGIHPVHLGIIFLANMELGYLTPPVGMNLFLASYRLNQPLSSIYRSTLPFFLIALIAVLIITYVPAFTTGVLSLF